MTILFLDDSQEVLEGFRKPLADVSGEEPVLLFHDHQTLQELVAAIEKAAPGVVLIDEYLAQGIRGHSVLAEVKERNPQVRAIGFSSSPSAEAAFLSAGADGFIVKDLAHPESSVEKVMQLLN